MGFYWHISCHAVLLMPAVEVCSDSIYLMFIYFILYFCLPYLAEHDYPSVIHCPQFSEKYLYRTCLTMCAVARLLSIFQVMH